jgi:lipopolysaccharide export system protein LptC
MNRVGFSILILFVLIVVVFNLPLRNTTSDTVLPSSQPALLNPTYRALNLSSQRFTEDGQLSHTIDAELMEHYDELGFMVFTKPIFTLYVNDGNRYTITAAEGTLYDNNRVLLETNILIQSQNPDDFIQQIEAQYVELDLNTKALRSDKAIVLSGVEFSMHSRGLEANLVEKQFALVDHVQSKFMPAL